MQSIGDVNTINFPSIFRRKFIREAILGILVENQWKTIFHLSFSWLCPHFDGHPNQGNYVFPLEMVPT